MTIRTITSPLFIAAMLLLPSSSSLAYAQEASPPVPSQANFKVLTDARIGIVKAALQLTPEQEKLWPHVEEAIRARAEARYNRMVRQESSVRSARLIRLNSCVDAMP
jgi:hypothetical protein